MLGYVRTGCGVVAGEEGGLARAGTGDAAGGGLVPSPPATHSSGFQSGVMIEKRTWSKQNRPISLGALRMALR